MDEADFLEIAVRDLRLANHAAGTQPAWLWSCDGSRILWTNAAGAAALDLRGQPASGTPLGLADPHRRQVAQLADTLPKSGAVRLERLRGFGAPLGSLTTCSCAWLELEGGTSAILIANLVNAGRPLPLAERLQFLLDGFARPAMALTAAGTPLASNRAAKGRHDLFAALNEPDVANARGNALREGQAEAASGATRFALFRIGSGHEISIVVLMTSSDGAEQADDEPLDEAFADEVLVDEDAPGDGTTVSSSELQRTQVPPGETVATALLYGTERGAKGHSSAVDESEPAPITHPLRFLWQMDAEGRFSLGSDEFVKLIGPLAAAALGRPWSEIAAVFALDPENLVANAVASRQTWSGITVHWPINARGDRVALELSGLPIFDRARNFVGYRGFGFCRDIGGLEQLAELRRQDSLFGATHPQPIPLPTPTESAPAVEARTATTEAATHGEGHDLAQPLPGQEPPPNVVPFRSPGDPRAPALSAVENHAFDEIARRLSARLEQVADAGVGHAGDTSDESDVEPPPSPPREGSAAPVQTDAEPPPKASEHSAGDPPQWLGAASQAIRGDSGQDKPLLERIPAGILIYRLDRLLYANPAFLERTGFASLAALSEAGGLDALYVQPLEPDASSSSDNGMPLAIASTGHGDAALARLYTISWDGESAMALIFAGEMASPVAAPQPRHDATPDIAAPAAAPPIDSFAAMFDATADGIVLFDAEGNILAGNRSAERLFGLPAEQLRQRHFTDLFMPESHAGALVYLRSIDDPSIVRLSDHGHEVLANVPDGKPVPLSMTMGRADGEGRLFAVFRDLSEQKESEAALADARRDAELAVASKTGVLAKIDHEVRVPLNAIIGFAEAMLEQRLGPLGNERYADYLRDIRAAGERVLAIVGDMLDLSRIESGKLPLNPASVSLNEIVAQCVGTLQPQANRERVVIRSSLAHHLPVVVADQQSLRQIATNLIASSIHLADPGGQVIVSTAVTDDGHVALRVRDTGRGLSDSDLAAAIEPYRAAAGEDRAVPDTSSLNLALTKALVEANRAQFVIRKAPQAGTMIEVIFRRAEPAAAGG